MLKERTLTAGFYFLVLFLFGGCATFLAPSQLNEGDIVVLLTNKEPGVGLLVEVKKANETNIIGRVLNCTYQDTLRSCSDLDVSLIDPGEVETGQLIEIRTLEKMPVEIFEKSEGVPATRIMADVLVMEVVSKSLVSISGKLVKAGVFAQKAYDASIDSYVTNKKEDHLVEVRFEDIAFVRAAPEWERRPPYNIELMAKDIRYIKKASPEASGAFRPSDFKKGAKMTVYTISEDILEITVIDVDAKKITAEVTERNFEQIPAEIIEINNCEIVMVRYIDVVDPDYGYGHAGEDYLYWMNILLPVPGGDVLRGTRGRVYDRNLEKEPCSLDENQ